MSWAATGRTMKASWRRERDPQSHPANKYAGRDASADKRNGSPAAIRGAGLLREGTEQSGRWFGNACVVARPISPDWPTRLPLRCGDAVALIRWQSLQSCAGDILYC